MPTYLTLFKHTEEAKRNIENTPEWLQEGKELAESMGGEVIDVYYGNIGEYDAVGITEYPDDRTIEQVRLAFESNGTHHAESYRIFEPEEHLEMIRELR